MSLLACRVNLIRSFLATNHMLVDDEWLSGCVEYLTEDSSNNYSDSDIQNLAKEQWLLNDLKDICPGSLPSSLKDQRKTVLNGRFVLQINAAIDIGTPAYQQYLKLQKVNMENVEATSTFEDRVSNHRMIKLYLTDGVQEVTAIEYKTMRNLSCDITPGCKVLLKGPIECRRGVLLLTESSIELLGGEVQDILLSNSLAGLLSSKLGVPVSQHTQDVNTTLSIPRNSNIPTPHDQMPSSRVIEVQNSPTLEPTTNHNRPVARVTSLQVASHLPSNQQTNIPDDDIDFEQLAAIEAQFNSSNKRPLDSSDTINPDKKIKMNTSVNNPLDYPDENDIFCQEDEEYLKEMESHFDRPKIEAKYPITVSPDPFIYIKQINAMSDTEKCGRVFRVKAQIMKLLSKLSVGKDGWTLRCTLIDGTGSIDADFTSDVLTTLVGLTPQEMMVLKKEMSKKPESREKAVLALQKIKDTLQVLYCIVELTILGVPQITSLIEFEDKHVEMLKKRSNICS